MNEMPPPTSSRCGQTAMVPIVPVTRSRRKGGSKKKQPTASLSDYPLPEVLKVDRKSFKTEGRSGIDVLKISKNGKLQARRLAISPDNRSIYLTSTRIKSFKGLITRMSQTKDTDAKCIDVGSVDHINKGQIAGRFVPINAAVTADGEDRENNTRGNVFAASASANIVGKDQKSLTVVYEPSSGKKFLNSSTVNGEKTMAKGLGKNKGQAKSKKQTVMNNSRLDTLDLIVPDPEDYKILLRTLEDLIELYRAEAVHYDPFYRFVEYQLIDMGKQPTDIISHAEWMALCSKINVPMAKQHLSEQFKNMCQRPSSLPTGLTFIGVATLLWDVQLQLTTEMGMKDVSQDPLLRVWYDLVDNDPVPANNTPAQQLTAMTSADARKSGIDNGGISPVAFLGFLRSHQKAHKSTLDHSMDQIAVLNRLKAPHNLLGSSKNDADQDDKIETNPNERLSMRCFLAYLLSDSNDIMDPAKCRVGADDMTHPLSHYWINTCHDTYLRRIKGGTVNDERMYMSALFRGVRCLELDVWDGPNGEPVVCADASMTSASVPKPLRLVKILNVIQHFLLANRKSFPVLLRIENHCSLPVQKKLAQQLYQTLGSNELIVVPDDTESVDEGDLLPSPSSMLGKVVIMGKRPKVIDEGCTVVHDDYDAENDEYYPHFEVRRRPIHDDVSINTGMDSSSMCGKHRGNAKDGPESAAPPNGVIVGFDAAGPITSTNPTMARSLVHHSPGELVFLAKQDAEKERAVVMEAQRKADEAMDAYKIADAKARNEIEEAGLKKEDVEALAEQLKSPQLDPKEHASYLNRSEEEGVEVQDFFGGAVNTARNNYSRADKIAYKCAQAEAAAYEQLNEENEKLDVLQLRLRKETDVYRQKNAAQHKAATELREKREHAITAKERVETVRILLKQSEKQLSSAETVVMTAKTEAKISEKRASEVEAKSQKAQRIAAEDRERADDASRREEELEKIAASLHDEYNCVALNEKSAKIRLDTAVAELEKVTEEVRLIENSTQFKTEHTFLSRQTNVHAHIHEHKDDSDSQTSNGTRRFMLKHAEKMREKRMLSDDVQRALQKMSDLKMEVQSARDEFERSAHSWKKQAELASKMRKQADRSAQASEAIAEHADEEREAANLRHVAYEKAKTNVTAQRERNNSLAEQLLQAERAAEEAEKLAEEARRISERYPENAEYGGIDRGTQQLIDAQRIVRDEALVYYHRKKVEKEEAAKVADEAKRYFESSSDVLVNAIRNAKKEQSRANLQTSASQSAVMAFNEAVVARREAEHAMELARDAREKLAEKEVAIRRAHEHKETKESRTEIDPGLARMTFLSFTKHRYWDQSLSLPNTYVHSFSQDVMEKMSKMESGHPNKLCEFTAEHLCRTFPPHGSMQKRKGLNYDPIFQWALGCQMVGINYFAFDNNVLKADGQFRRNGSCGYVLKPAHLIDPSTKKVEKEQHWQVNVLCGSCLPLQIAVGRKGESSTFKGINPFVKILVYEGLVDGGKRVQEHRTSVIRGNAFFPVWDEKPGFAFTVQNPTMSIVIFSVWDRDEQGMEHIIGSASVPLSCMREGHRSVSLFDPNNSRVGPYAHARLFVKTVRTAS